MEIINRTIRLMFVFFVKLYQVALSPLLAPTCRHHPSCSQYAIDAVNQYGFFKGVWMAIRRIIRCRPGGTEGYDPVDKRGMK